MKEINAELINVILNDSAIKTALGYTATDERIYAWNPAEDVIYSDNKKGAIFYRIIYGKRPKRWSYPKQFANGSIYFKVVSIDQETTDTVGERLIELFDLETIETTNWRIGHSELLSYNDAKPEGSGRNTQWSKMVTFMFTNILKRA
jgi:hypothetical protein